ncbi:hypothetical protein [Prescottella agglutinans]|uniref:Uncharacterized protein n=1 Tax=Prescottella agglutinans TaxID=1644129 RepID=A0ABT6MM75_9NOCA|nr:hypothetical protein [Prescottella agglutinans]MDH6284604.1 hypothetical protein [Prescottella agglutinans]
MSTLDVQAQIPDVKPVAPPFLPDLIGKFAGVWWVLLIVGAVAFVVGLASYRGFVQTRTSVEFPLLFGGPVVVALMIWALSYGT